MTLWKATRPDGTDFRTGTIGYAAACGTGQPVTWAGDGPMRKGQPGTYLSLSSEPGEVLTGGSWPCRLFEAEAAGRVMGHGEWPWKVCARRVLVVREAEAHLALGPNGRDVAALIGRAGRLTAQEARDLAAAWDAAWAADRAAAGDAAGDAARAAARAAAAAMVVRDLISDEQYQLLAAPWLSVTGEAS